MRRRFLPTPQAHDAAPGNPNRVGRYGTKHGGRNLNDEIAAGMWISSAADSPVSPSARPDDDWVSPTLDGSGRSSHGFLASYDPAMHLWKTSQVSLLPTTGMPCQPFSETWPPSGMMRNGQAFQRPLLVPRTFDGGSSLWPTPTKADGERGSLQYQGNHNPTLLGVVRRRWPTPKGSADKYGSPRENDRGDLQSAVRMWPTPRSSPSENRQTKRTPSQESSRHGLSLAAEVGGQLNPVWVNWLMSFPLTWHAESVSEVLTWIEIFLGLPRGSLDGCLGSNPTAMPSFPPLRNGSASKSSRRKKRD